MQHEPVMNATTTSELSQQNIPSLPVIERGHKMDMKETFATLIVTDALGRLLKIHAEG